MTKLPRVLKLSLLDRPQPDRTPQLPFKIVRKALSIAECDFIRSRRHDPQAWRPFRNRAQSACKHPDEWEYIDDALVLKIGKLMHDLNDEHWHVDARGLYMYPRVLEYRRGHSMASHVDYQPQSGEYDKLCAVLLLSASNEYDGGDLSTGNYMGKPSRLHKGDILVFPTVQPHWVSLVTRGRRLSMAFWSWGPPYR